MIDIETMSAAELMKTMAAREFFLIESTPTAPFERFQAVLKDHLVYLIKLERDGILFASGPLKDRSDKITGAGLTIIRASDFEEAETIAQGDPFVVAGLRTAKVHKWIVNEGRISLSIDLSNGSATLA